ncbi:MAG: hypothetical protein AB7F50_01545 [Fimbriimonadaceae bacterium]
MAVVPDQKNAAISFYEQRTAAWTANAAAIGLTPGDMTAFTPMVTGARTAFTSAEAARAASKNATVTLDNSVDTMRDRGAALIAKIKAFAESSGNPNVYVIASIPPPADPTPAPPPTPPSQVQGTVNNDGNVVLRWKATKVNGEFFSVHRLLAGGTWTALGSVNAKSFTDTGLPAGNSWAQYQVKSHRGTEVSEGSEPVVILFGVQQQAA